MRSGVAASVVLAALLAAGPVSGQPATSQRVAYHPAAGGPAPGSPATGQPAMGQRTTGQRAADQPAIRPMRDVAVDYRAQGQPDASGPAQSERVRMFWTNHGKLARLEIPGMPMWGIIDLARDRMTVVFTAQRGYVELPLDPDRIPGLSIPPGITMTRVGSATVAGLGCTVWRVRGPGDAGTACITAGGLVLRAEGHGHGGGMSANGTLRAMTVRYEPQPATLFAPPPGFHRMDLPHIGLDPAGPSRP
ncbi:MAG: hypothetical protein ACREFY_08500 [Acetobacteraceae bacterium]